jgi:hypothetical protein
LERIQMYLDIVPLPVLMGLALASMIGMLMIPSRLRLWLLLTALPLWLVLSLFVELGIVQAVSKATGMLYFAILAFAALVHPGPKRRIPFILWLYPVLGFISIFYVTGASDSAIAIVLRIQWFFLTLAALLLVRNITTEAALVKVLFCLFIGTTAAGGLSFVAVFMGAGGYGRVKPWGANQNHVGPVFILMAPLGLYFGFRLRHTFLRLASFGSAGIGGLMSLLTASRSVVYPTAFVVGVLAWEFRRKPLVIVAAVLGVIPVIYFAGGYVASADVDRLGSLDSERYSRWEKYSEVIMEHPMFGIMFEQGELAASSEEVGGHAHNAYIDALRVYGLSLCIPLFGLAAWSCWCAFRVWLRRKSFAEDPLLITMLVAYLAMVYLHGMVTIEIYYPNYTWSFFHVLVAALFITLAANRGRELAPSSMHALEEYGHGGHPPEWSRPYPSGHPAPALAAEPDVRQAG